MPAGIGVGQILGLFREVRGLDGASPRIVISGPGAEGVAAALAVAGDRSAIAIDGDPAAAAVVVRIVEGDPGEGERAILRRLAKKHVPVIVLRRGGSLRIPHVLADDVVDVGTDDLGADDIGRVAGAIVGVAGSSAPPLAAALPVLLAPVCRRLVARTAFANAAFASARLGHAQLPLLTLAQARMLLLLGVARGETLPREPEELLRTAGPYLVAALGTGFGARALVRRLPRRGPIVRATIAYGGTRALGLAALRR